MDDAALPTAIADEAALRRRYAEPGGGAVQKCLPRLDSHCRAFIALSPFLVLATSGADGSLDASPRGDAPGFVAAVDDTTLLLPDRPGNNRCDSLTNVLETGRVGLLFFVPGFTETLRVNGTAVLTADPDRLAPFAVAGKEPKSGLVITVEEVFFHCSKALIRSKLWDPAGQRDRKTFPTLGRILADQIAGRDADQYETYIQENYRTELY